MLVNKACYSHGVPVCAGVLFLALVGADVCLAQQERGQAFVDAATAGDMDEVRTLVDQGANVNARDSEGVTALMWAAEKGHAQIVQYLLEKGADVNARESTAGMTALMVSAAGGYEEVVEALLAKGAEVDARDKNLGATALLGAAEWGHTGVIRILIAKGADMNARSKSGFTPLQLASANGHLESVKVILAAGANVNAQDEKYGATALLGAIGNGHEEVVRLLLEKGADPNLRSKAGQNAKEFARERQQENLVTIIDSFTKGTRVGTPGGPRPRIALLGIWTEDTQIELHWGYALLLATREKSDLVPQLINVDLSLLSRVAGGTKWSLEDAKWSMGKKIADKEALERMEFCHATHGLVLRLEKTKDEWAARATVYWRESAKQPLSSEFESESIFSVAEQVILWLCKEMGITLSEVTAARIQSVDTKDIEAYGEVAKATMALEEGRVHQAIGLAKKAIEQAPNLAVAHQTLGNVYLALGEFSLAESSLRESVRLDPDRVGRGNLAILYRKKGDIEAAIREYQEVIKRHPGYPYVHVLLAMAYETSKDFANAQASVTEALQIDPWVPDGHYTLGLIYRDQGSWEKAANEFRKAIADYPSDIQAYVMLGITYERRGDIENAIKVLEEGISVNPDYGKAHNNLAACYVALGDYDKAWGHVREAERVGFDVAPVILETLRTKSREPGQR